MTNLNLFSGSVPFQSAPLSPPPTNDPIDQLLRTFGPMIQQLPGMVNSLLGTSIPQDAFGFLGNGPAPASLNANEQALYNLLQQQISGGGPFGSFSGETSPYISQLQRNQQAYNQSLAQQLSTADSQSIGSTILGIMAQTGSPITQADRRAADTLGQDLTTLQTIAGFIPGGAQFVGGIMDALQGSRGSAASAAPIFSQLLQSQFTADQAGAFVDAFDSSLFGESRTENNVAGFSLEESASILRSLQASGVVDRGFGQTRRERAQRLGISNVDERLERDPIGLEREIGEVEGRRAADAVSSMAGALRATDDLYQLLGIQGATPEQLYDTMNKLTQNGVGRLSPELLQNQIRETVEVMRVTGVSLDGFQQLTGALGELYEKFGVSRANAGSTVNAALTLSGVGTDTYSELGPSVNNLSTEELALDYGAQIASASASEAAQAAAAYLNYAEDRGIDNELTRAIRSGNLGDFGEVTFDTVRQFAREQGADAGDIRALNTYFKNRPGTQDTIVEFQIGEQVAALQGQQTIAPDLLNPAAKEAVTAQREDLARIGVRSNRQLAQLRDDLGEQLAERFLSESAENATGLGQTTDFVQEQLARTIGQERAYSEAGRNVARDIASGFLNTAETRGKEQYGTTSVENLFLRYAEQPRNRGRLAQEQANLQGQVADVLAQTFQGSAGERVTDLLRSSVTSGEPVTVSQLLAAGVGQVQGAGGAQEFADAAEFARRALDELNLTDEEQKAGRIPEDKRRQVIERVKRYVETGEDIKPTTIRNFYGDPETDTPLYVGDRPEGEPSIEDLSANNSNVPEYMRVVSSRKPRFGAAVKADVAPEVDSATNSGGPDQKNGSESTEDPIDTFISKAEAAIRGRKIRIEFVDANGVLTGQQGIAHVT